MGRNSPAGLAGALLMLLGEATAELGSDRRQGRSARSQMTPGERNGIENGKY